ncbi:hypothetical protein EV360DRAFT_71621 [Lentinula raphanica]|nr:hypothetical protein EV360DRAFT_71621 [Lentinula raphanica]
MPRPTASQALIILLIGAVTTPGILAAPTPTPPRSFDAQDSLSGGQTQRLQVDTLQNCGVDCASIAVCRRADVDLTEQVPESDQNGKDSTRDNINSIPVNLEERVILWSRGLKDLISKARKKKTGDKQNLQNVQLNAQNSQNVQNVQNVKVLDGGKAKEEPKNNEQEVVQVSDKGKAKEVPENNEQEVDDEQEVDNWILRQLERNKKKYGTILNTWKTIRYYKRADFYEDFTNENWQVIQQMETLASLARDRQLPYPLEVLDEYIQLPLDIENVLAEMGRIPPWKKRAPSSDRPGAAGPSRS